MGSAECLWLVGIDFCHLKTDNLENLEHAWHPQGGGGSTTPRGGTPPPPHHTVVTLWSVVLRLGVFWRLLASEEPQGDAQRAGGHEQESGSLRVSS